MKQHREALNYSWDSSQQTLNGTWGNSAVSLQLILPLHSLQSVCVSQSVCVCVLPNRDRWSAPSHRLFLTACAKKTTSFPFSCVLNSARLIWQQTCSNNESVQPSDKHSCWRETTAGKWDDKVATHETNESADFPNVCFCLGFYLEHDCLLLSALSHLLFGELLALF